MIGLAARKGTMSGRVSYLVKRVERGVRSQLDDALQELQVTTPEYTALSVLRHRSGLSSAQLARRAFVSAQAMNLIVVALERRGWIARSPDPDNGRILRAKLTPLGKEMLVACDRATASVEKALLAELSASEVAALRSMLERCANALSEAALRERGDS
jgi:DNA-binding MarR family transcriptional regulator